MLVIAPSGSRFCFDGNCGIYYWGAHEHDGVWHLALIESAFSSFSFRFPTYIGQVLSGYNYLLDLVLFLLTHIGLSSSILYFKIQPLAWFFTFTYLLYRIAKTMHRNVGFIHFLFSFVFFSASFGYIIQIVRHGTVLGSSGIPTMQGAVSMTNPQFMWSLCVLLAMLLVINIGKKTWLLGVLILVGLGLKFYFILPAIIIASIYLCSLIYSKSYSKAIVTAFAVFLGTVTAYLLFYANNGASIGGLVWNPLAISHQIVEDKNMWFNQEWVDQRYFLIQAGKFFSPRLWFIEIKTIGLYILFNYGIRLLGIIGSIAYIVMRKKTSNFSGTMLVIVVACTAVPLLFVQKGTWWNTIQFLYYGIFFASILTAQVVWLIINKLHPVIRYGVLAGCLLLFAPATYDIVYNFTQSKNISYIPDSEIQAMQFLRTLPDGGVLTQTFEPIDSNILPDRYDTAYVSAYSGQQTYIADDAQLKLLGINYQTRLESINQSPCEVLSEVKYVYIRKNRGYGNFQCLAKQSNMRIVYSNDEVDIWSKL